MYVKFDQATIPWNGKFEYNEHQVSTQLTILPKVIEVVCAIIESPDGVLCALRSSTMSHPLLWEFPGGKIETGETSEEALCREIAEELSVEVKPVVALPISDYSYVPGEIIRLHPFICSINKDLVPVPKEHAAIRWVKSFELQKLDWAAADLPVLDCYLKTHL
jgi:8-oxo-dGTP diphosphatase